MAKTRLPVAVLTALLVIAGLCPCWGQVGYVVYEEDPALAPEPLHPGHLHWFVGFEFQLVFADVDQRLRGIVDFGELGTDVVQLPTADLDWDIGGRFELGAHLPSGCGDVSLVFRALHVEGSEILPNFDLFGEALLDSFLEVGVIDFDYTTPRLPLDSMWSLRGRIGPRFARVDFETVAEGFLVGQRARSLYRSAGGHAGLDIEAALGHSGLRLLGRVDGAALGGRVRQQFDEVFFLPGLMAIGAGTVVHEDRFVPTLAVELGLGWDVPWSCHGLNFAVGYRFERWWNVGDAFDSHADLNLHGVFFRAEWNF
jgi:hypothetical protein